ncbi:MAG: HAD family hydrolase [Actinobacteria bacterium]|nr:MAG: HAD family hydrolase [Actinomycetota bacterium]
MDGVLTETAGVHKDAWKRLFDSYLRERSERTGEPFRPFETEDYARYVDGKPRYDGARSFLESRGIHLPFGSPDDPPEKETVTGLGNRKNSLFHESLSEKGVKAYESSVRFIKDAKAKGARTAVITSSRNGREVLEAAGIRHLFESEVTGIESDQMKLKGKPEPDIFLEAARRLGVEPEKAAVIEDALSGVEAGRRGGFGVVIGVDRIGQAGELLDRGADVVVKDLSQLRYEPT